MGKPHKCPVCDGTGKVNRPPWIPGDCETWTASSLEMYECQACGGRGIVWESTDLEFKYYVPNNDSTNGKPYKLISG